MCFSVPKSVSLYLAETDDPALERMIQEAFKETMADAENRMEARVRVGDQDDNRTVANMVYAAFVHRETRPIGGIPDPHYHIHAFAMNAVYDDEESGGKLASL
jgi:TrwC relaxase.